MKQGETKLSKYTNLIGLILILLFIISTIFAIQVESNFVLLVIIATNIAVLCILAVFVSRCQGGNQEVLLLLPAVLSTFQNVYLAPFSRHLPESTLQFLIIINFLYAIVMIACLSMFDKMVEPEIRGIIRFCFRMIAILMAYGTILMVINSHDVMAGVASARNILSPVVFFAMGVLGAQFSTLERFGKAVTILGIFALVFAFFEWTTPSVWRNLGLHYLWEKKGIAVNPVSLIPHNFYASEQIVPGEFIRRMAGPFADPVNFGTFLFALILFSYLTKRKLILAVAIIASVLTVSKGALLGLLVFLAVWTYYFRSRFEFMLASIALGSAGLYFYLFTLESSTGSTAVHIGGFLAAFVELPQHPLGRGFGGTGVLAGLFSDEGSDSGSAVLESGIGSIIGQLGLLGVILFTIFFAKIYKRIVCIPNIRVRVFGLAMLFAFILNAAFNEVALSPNSSGLYFIGLGILFTISITESKIEPDYSALAKLGKQS